MSGKVETETGPPNDIPELTDLEKTTILIFGIVLLFGLAITILKQLYCLICWISNLFTTKKVYDDSDWQHFRIKYRSKQNQEKLRRLFVIPEAAIGYGLPLNIKVKQLSEIEYCNQWRRKELVVIAVDATPFRGAGLYYNKVYDFALYYSVDWQHLMNFVGMDSDKFEIFNALLAVQMFQSDLTSLESESILFKVDNTVILDGYRRERNAKYRAIYKTFAVRLAHTFSSNITLQHTTKKFDRFLQVADKLSRNNLYDANEVIRNKLNCRIDWFEDSFAKETLADVVNQLKQMSISQFGDAYSFIK